MFDRLAGLLNGRRLEERRLVASIPDGERVYAIGDIHGRSDLLRMLLKQIATDAKAFKGKVTLVCIGDYIDRGPDSKGVVEILLKDLPPHWQKVFLRGNHEQAMLDFMENPQLRTEWLGWGGVQALESYDIALYGPKGARAPEALAPELLMELEKIGHKGFFEATQLTHISGNYLFVHAGVRRGIPLEKQMANDLIFIREDFMGRAHNLPYRVVFGHTILPEPLVEDDRIGLDTGAFQTGTLTAVRLEADSVEIMQATI